MIPSEYRPLLEKIASRTAQGRLNWETTSDERKFNARVGDFYVSVNSFNAYPDDELVIGFEIRDSLGDKIDGIYIGENDEAVDDFRELSALFAAARRSALRIDDTISSIMSALD